MSGVVPAAIAFFALGANFLGTLHLLLLQPRSRALRWFALFELEIMVWLALQGWTFAVGQPGPTVEIASAQGPQDVRPQEHHFEHLWG